MSDRATPTVLSIAGSDSGGGAGIQADLKAFAACGVHGTVAITAVTVQNTVAVKDVVQLPADLIVQQVEAIAEDIGVDAVKIGMLGTSEAIDAASRALDLLGDVPVVVDPVMVAESGGRLLATGAAGDLRERVIPRATVVTPNLPEARALVEAGAGAGAGADELAAAIHRLGPSAVVVTGGHGVELVDVFHDGRQVVEIRGERYPDGAAHGSGCTHSSVLAAQLALGLSPLDAARRAQAMASRAVRDGLRDIGAGAGPVDVLGLGGRRGEFGDERPGRPGEATGPLA